MMLPPAWLFPVDRAASLTERALVIGLGASLLVLLVGLVFGRVRIRRLGGLGLGLTLASWALLYLGRPPWMREALADEVRSPQLSAPAFRTVAPGLEVADWTLRTGGAVVEELALVRLDPRRYRFAVSVDAKEPRDVTAWRQQLGAAVVVNGSYFEPDHQPSTPLRSGGHALGPTQYTSTHGAFVADPGTGVAAIVDLASTGLPGFLTPFPEAMVSYPLLLAPDGTTRAEGSHDWLASRTFVAIDGSGRVVLGTTRLGYFTLRRLASFLKEAPLGLKTALNFDGGPIAAQAVRAGAYTRTINGTAETNAGADVLRAKIQATRAPGVALPIILAAYPR